MPVDVCVCVPDVELLNAGAWSVACGKCGGSVIECISRWISLPDLANLYSLQGIRVTCIVGIVRFHLLC